MREWITEQVYIRNFNSIGSIPIVYDVKKGSSIFVGANGSGKTTLLSALLYIKYNSTVNNKPIDSIINTVNGNKALVLEKFKITDSSKPKVHNKRFVLYRGRKDNVFGVCKLFDDIDINLNAIKELNKNIDIENVLKEYGTITNFSTGKLGEKELLEEYLIIDETIFRSLVYVSGYNDDFADFGKTKRREYISNLFNLQWFEDLVALKKVERTAELKKFAKTKELYDSLNLKKEVKTNEINLLSTQNLESKKAYDFDKEIIDKEISVLRKNISDILNNVEISEILKNKKELTDNLNLLEQKIYLHEKYKNDVDSKEILLESKKDSYNQNKIRLTNDITSITTSIDEFDFVPNIDIDSKKQEREELKNNISINEKLLEDIQSKVSALATNKTVIASKKQSMDLKKQELTVKLEDIQKLKDIQTNKVDDFEVIASDIKEVQSDITNLKLKNQELLSLITSKQSDIDKSIKTIEFYTNNDICDTCKQKIEPKFKQTIIDGEQTNIDSLQKLIEEKRVEINIVKESINTKLDEITKIEKNKEQYNNLKLKLDEITNNISFIENEINSLDENEINNLIADFEQDKKELMEIAVAHENDFGQAIIKDNIKILNDELYSLNSFIESYNDKKLKYENLKSKKESLLLEQINNVYPTELEDEIKELTEKIKSFDISLIRESINTTETQIEAIESQLKQVDDINHSITIEETKLHTLSEQYILSIKDTKDIEKQLEEIDETMKSHSDEIDEMNKCITIKDNIITLFTSEELKSSLFNHYIELMNFYSHNITTELGMKYRVIFQPDFEVTVEGYNVSPDYKGMSGGEKKQINFIVLATFHKLLTMFGNFKTNVIFLDEYIDSKLDVINIEIMVDTCIRYFKEQSLYMVIHNDRVYDKFDNIYHIKNDIFTTMVEIDKENEDAWQNLLSDYAKQ